MYPSLFQCLVVDAQKSNLWLPIAAQVISWRLEGSFVQPVLPLSTPKHPETQKPRNPQQSNDPTDHTHTSRRLLGLFARLSVGRISKKCIVTLWLGSVSGFKLGQVCNSCFLVTWLSFGAKALASWPFLWAQCGGYVFPAVQRHLDGWSRVTTGDGKTSP